MRKVYGRILRQVREPVIIHWLGEMFDPALAGYWGGGRSRRRHGDLPRHHRRQRRQDRRRQNLAALEGEGNRDARASCRRGVRMYTGDDFNYAELIAGDEEGYSDALLGIFDAIAPAASAGLARLAAGDLQGFHGILEPTVPLSRHIFRRRRASTKPASCSSPGSTACRIISSWSAGRKAPARCCISPSCSVSPTRRACCTIRSSPRRA